MDKASRYLHEIKAIADNRNKTADLRDYYKMAGDADKAARLDVKLARLQAKLDAASDVIDQVDDYGSEILRLVYVEGKDWEEAASKIGYSESHSYRLARKAKEKMEALIPDSY